MKINLEPEFQFQLWLTQAGLNASMMNEKQFAERKRMFYAAYGMGIKICQDESLLNTKGVRVVKSIFKKLQLFFTEEKLKQDKN